MISGPAAAGWRVGCAGQFSPGGDPRPTLAIGLGDKLNQEGDDMEHTGGTELKDREFVLAQIVALRDKKSPLSDGEWALLLDLLHQLGVARH
jgi:hypothetical protein